MKKIKPDDVLPVIDEAKLEPTISIEPDKIQEVQTKKKNVLFRSNFLTLFLTFAIITILPLVTFLEGINLKTSKVLNENTLTALENSNILNNLEYPNTGIYGKYTVLFNKSITKLNDVDLFRFVSNEQQSSDACSVLHSDIDMDTKITYYSVGKVINNEYAGYELIYGFLPGCFTKFYDLPIIAFRYKTDAVVFTNRMYKQSVKVNNNYIETSRSLNFVERIYLKGGIHANTDATVYNFFNLSNVKFNNFYFRESILSNYTDENNFVKSIKVNNIQMYLSKDKDDVAIYIKTKDGFYMGNYIGPVFTLEPGNDNNGITWKTKLEGKNGNIYDFISIGSCFRNKLEIVNIDDSKLVEAGKTDIGDTVYEIKDYKNDTYEKKIYEQDYLPYDLNKMNTTSLDDEKKFTYEEFVQRHPVFYWKDPFGRLIKFANRDYIMTGGCAKPAIYLYTEKPTQVKVNIDINGELMNTYPKYNDGWNVETNSQSEIISDGKKYDYLFWDGQFNARLENNDGFSIKSNDLDDFFNSELSTLSFNTKETKQFIEYWLPIMKNENKPYYFITFIDEKQLDKVAPLSVLPKPDSYKRYFMLWRGEDKFRQLNQPEYKSFTRKGFTLFEWGGAKID